RGDEAVGEEAAAVEMLRDRGGTGQHPRADEPRHDADPDLHEPVRRFLDAGGLRPEGSEDLGHVPDRADHHRAQRGYCDRELVDFGDHCATLSRVSGGESTSAGCGAKGWLAATPAGFSSSEAGSINRCSTSLL